MKIFSPIYQCIFVLLATVSLQAQQSNLNAYKVVEVPSTFTVLKTKDRYMLNTYTKLHLQKYGFVAHLSEEPITEEAMVDRCDKLYVDLIDDSGMFMTRLKVVFKDCLGHVIYTTDEGSSRNKDLTKGYREALGNAFKSFVSAYYNYDPSLRSQRTQMTADSQTTQEIVPAIDDPNALFAQPIENGYQLVDKTPAVIFKLQKTSSPDVFLAQKGTLSGTLIKKGSVWNFEFYKDGVLAKEEVKIKF